MGRALVVTTAAVLTLIGCSDDPDDDSGLTVQSTAASAGAAGDDVASDEATWTRVAAEERLDDIGSLDIEGELNDVAMTDRGFVAVGVAEGNAAVWTSGDGVSWRRATQVPDTQPRGFSGGMAVTDEGDLAVTARGAFGIGEVAVWVSPSRAAPGRNWNTAVSGPGVFGDDTNVADVTQGGPGWVAVGNSRDANDPATSAVVWTATDEASWIRVPHDEDTFGDAAMLGVVAGAPGLLAFGASDGDPAAWTSPDGRSWTRVAFDETDFDEIIPAAVTAGGPGWVAVGGTADGAPAAWTSPDGTNWTPAETFVGGPTETLVAVTASPSRLVAVGTGTSLWTSTDGTTWTNVPHDTAVQPAEERVINALVADGDLVVAVGAVLDDSLASRPAVWNATLPD